MIKRFAVFLSIMVTILTLGHYLVIVTAKFFIVAGCGWSQWQMIAASVLMSLLFVAGNMLSFRFYNWFSKLAYLAVMIWIGLFIYLFFAAAVFWIIYDLGLQQSPWLLGHVLYGLAVVIGIYGIINANNVRVAKYDLKLANLPQAWADKQFVFISDTHFGQIRNLAFATKLANLINELKPELLLIGGDMFDGGRVPGDELGQIFGAINAPKGKLYVTGNHEEFTASRENVESLPRHGIKILDSEFVNIDGLQIAGVDYLKSAGSEKFAASLKPITLDSQLPSILIKHVPNNLEVSEAHGFSAQLSGHTHRGQIFPGRLFTRRIFKGYDYGLQQFKRMQVLVSSGAGTWGPPMRVATQSEIVLVTLRKA